MNRQDWQNVFGEPDASFDLCFQQTLNKLEEKKMKKFTTRTAVLVFALLLALMGAAYAAANIRTLGGLLPSVPEDFNTGFDQELTHDFGGFRYRVLDAYLNGNSLMALMEVSRADGTPGLFLMDGDAEEDPIYCLYPDRAEDSRTIGEYARDQQLPINYVGAKFTQPGSEQNVDGRSWMEEDQRRIWYAELPNVQVENGQASVDWLMTYVQYGEKPEDITVPQESVPVTLRAEESPSREVAVNHAVAGMPVVVDKVTVRQTRMDMQLDICCHLEQDSDDADALEMAAITFFRVLDPDTMEPVPVGSGLVSSHRSVQAKEFVDDNHTVSLDWQGDTVLLQAVNPFLGAGEWENDLIEVKIR